MEQLNKKQFEDGVFDISSDEYHQSSGVSRSALMLLKRSPYHFWYEYKSGLAEKKEATDAMNLGSAFHTLVLEPHKFNDEFIIRPSIDRRTTKGKEEYAEFEVSAGMRIILTNEQYNKAEQMANALIKNSTISNLLDGALFEQSIFWTDEDTGLQFKARPDIWQPAIVSDLKSTADAEYRAFQYSSSKHGYFLQAGMMYEAMLSINKPFEAYVIIASEKEPPYAPAIYPMSEKAIEFGREMFGVYKRHLKQCITNDEWPSYPMREIEPSPYAYLDIEPLKEALYNN